MVAPFSKFYGKVWVGFCLNIEKRFFLEVSFQNQHFLLFVNAGVLFDGAFSL